MRNISFTVAAALMGALLFLGTGSPSPARAAVVGDITFTSEPFVPVASFPTALAFTPDGRMLYNERCGAVRVVEPDGDLLATPFATIPSVACTGDYGLIGLAIDPDYANNHYVYISYMRRTDDPADPDPLRARGIVERFTDLDNIGTSPVELINDLPETDPTTNPNHYHGINNLHFGPDGKLYLSMGENNNKPASRDLSSPLGKILRVNKEDGSAPSDNPFFNTPGADPRVFALGFRNSFDFDFHPANDMLYATENGFNTCDELNLVVPAGDYEWNTAFDPDTNEPLGETCTSGVGTEAIYYFRFFEFQCEWCNNSTSAPTGILAIDGDQYPALGDSFLACEFRSSVLRLLQLGPDLDEVIAEPRAIYNPSGEENYPCRLDIEMSPSGDIYYTNTGWIRRLIIDSDSDGLEDKLDNCPLHDNAGQENAIHPATPEGDACEDPDADAVFDATDTCPDWPNPSQAVPDYGPLVGTGQDSDCDGFTDTRETYLGTDPTRQCPADTSLNNEDPDSWPVDINDNRIANTIDVGVYVFTLNESNPNHPGPNTNPAFVLRHDLNGNGTINTIDVGTYVFVLNKTCSPSGP